MVRIFKKVSLYAVLIFLPSSALGAWQDVTSNIHPYISLSEEYNDNLYLEKKDKTGDFITSINPGIRFSHSVNKLGLELDYSLGLISHANQSNNNYISHTGKMNAIYRFDPHWSFKLREYLIRSEEPRESDYSSEASVNSRLISTSHDRAVYLRNVIEPAIEYQFGRENHIALLYRNNLFRPESRIAENSTENSFNPILTFWFNNRNGIILNYTFLSGIFDKSPNFTGHTVSGRYIHRFKPQFSAFCEFGYLSRSFDSPGKDYQAYNPSLGLEYAFSATSRAVFQAGYFWDNIDGTPSLGGLSFNMSISGQQSKSNTYIFSLIGGYREDYFTSQNLGLTKYYRAIATINHQLLRRTAVKFSGSVERVEFSEINPGRIDWTYTFIGSVSYQILKKLFISLEASHSRDNSNQNQFEYINNRLFLLLTATF